MHFRELIGLCGCLDAESTRFAPLVLEKESLSVRISPHAYTNSIVTDFFYGPHNIKMLAHNRNFLFPFDPYET
jgi:hypothetical protein